MSEIRTAFWNLQNLFDTTESDIAADLDYTPDEGWTNKRLKEKLDALAAVINDMFDGAGPELLGLCEVENKGLVQKLVKRLNGKNLRIAHVESPDIRGIDTSLVYSADRFKIVPDGDGTNLQEAHPKAHLVHMRFSTRDILEVPLFLHESCTKLVVLVNHWPSRRQGRYESEPYRIAVANHCANIVRRHLKVPRTEFLQLPDDKESLNLINERWNRNVLVMGDLNDYPYDRSVLSELQAASGFDKIEELFKSRGGRNIPLPKSYLRRQPTLFNCMWKFLSEPDQGTYYFSEDINTMNVLDHFIVSRGLLCGRAGLKICLDTVDIFKHPSMTSLSGRPQPFKFEKPKKSEKPASGVSDHFPITALIKCVK